MNRIASLFFLLALFASVASAQNGQPNSEWASLRIEGNDGPPYPIVNIFLFGGTSASMEIQAGANVHFILAQAPRLTLTGLPWLGGVVDLDLLTDPGAVVLIMDGFSGSPDEYHTDNLGHFESSYPLPSTITHNLQMAFQAIVEDPGSPFGFTLTAATSTRTYMGLTPVYFTLGGNNCIFANTNSQFGINIPFYSTTYTGCWVCANGFLSFGAANTDFTPTLGEMHSGPPRLAPFWADLDPTVPGAGPISMTVDQIDPHNPVLTFKYESIPDWPVGVNGGLGWHTFGARIDITSGDLEIHEYPSCQNSNYDIIAGISAGGSLDPTGASPLDISAEFALGPYVGQPNEGIYEGFRGATSVTGAFPVGQTWDLAGTYWRYRAISPGAPGASYVMEFFLPSDPANP